MSQRVEQSAEAPGTGGSRLGAARDWLSGRANTSLGRLALLWFRRYFEASRNSGAATSTYVMLSVFPTALVVIAVFNLARGDENAFADQLITHMNLEGSTASVVDDLFGTTANNLLAASLAIVIGFLLWGLSIGQQYQDLYARAWRIHVGTAADQVRFTIWFFVSSGADRADDRLGGGASGRRLACAGSGLDRRLAWSSGCGRRASCSTARSHFARSCPARSWRRSSSAGRSRPRRSGSGRGEQNAKAFGSFGVVIGDPRLRPDRRHALDGLRRLLAGLGGVATRRERPEGLAAI